MIREEDTIAWKRYNPNMEKSIFISIYNVRLDTFPAYKKNSVLHSPCGEQGSSTRLPRDVAASCFIQN